MQALTFKARNPLLESNEIFIADYSKNSREKRLYRINLQTGEVDKTFVSHGGGHISGTKYGRGKYWGDQDHDGMIDRCKIPDEITQYWPTHFKENNPEYNREGMTRPGFFATKYPVRYSFKKHWLDFGKYGRNAIPLKGLTPGLNSDFEGKMMVLNAPRYNANPKMGESLAMGRGSSGPAIRPQDRRIFQGIPENTIFYSYVPTCEEDMDKVFKQIDGWERFCGAHRRLEKGEFQS